MRPTVLNLGQDLDELARAAAEREFKSSAEALGGLVLDAHETAAVHARRADLAAQAAAAERAAERALTATTLRAPHERPALYGRAEAPAGLLPDETPTFDPLEALNEVQSIPRHTVLAPIKPP